MRGKYGPQKTPYLETFHTVLYIHNFMTSCSFVTTKIIESITSICSGTNLFSNIERSHYVFITLWPLYSFGTSKSIELTYLFTQAGAVWKIKGSCTGLKNQFDIFLRNIYRTPQGDCFLTLASPKLRKSHDIHCTKNEVFH